MWWSPLKEILRQRQRRRLSRMLCRRIWLDEGKVCVKSLIAMVLLFGSAIVVSPQQQMPPEIPFDSVDNFFKLPAELYFGEGAGVAVNSKGHIFVFTRGNVSGPAFGAAAAMLLEFGPDGKYLREIGHNLY